MENLMKLGYIDYLNCYPFYYHMFEKEPIDSIEIFPDYPSNLNSSMKSGELHMSPISSGAYPEIAGNVLLIPDFCLSSVGYVGSVNLVSNLPIEDLNGKTIGVTSASGTSVNLMKILLEKFYNLKPNYIITHPMPNIDEGLDAALLIGNEAMLQLAHPVSFKYDIGELWHLKTGYPAVFAVFAVQKSAVNNFKDKINAIIHSYSKSLECVKSEKDIVVAKAKERYPDIIYDIGYYFSLFRFDFTEYLQEALMLSFRLGNEMGLLKKVDKIEMFENNG